MNRENTDLLWIWHIRRQKKVDVHSSILTICIYSVLPRHQHFYSFADFTDFYVLRESKFQRKMRRMTSLRNLSKSDPLVNLSSMCALITQLSVILYQLDRYRLHKLRNGILNKKKVISSKKMKILARVKIWLILSKMKDKLNKEWFLSKN